MQKSSGHFLLGQLLVKEHNCRKDSLRSAHEVSEEEFMGQVFGKIIVPLTNSEP